MKAGFQHLARLLFLALLLTPGLSFAGFSIQSGQLVDNNGVPLIMRGINYPYTWYQSRPTQQDFAAMAATGANTVRIVLSFVVQMSGNGTVHPTSGDTYTVTGTAGGQPFTLNGTF